MVYSIQELIEQEAVETLMQLVISPNKDFAAGVEALSRGIHPKTGDHIPPKALMEAAKKEGLNIELEKLMIRKAFETFKIIFKEKSELLLFVNVSSEMAEEAIKTGFIIQYAEHFGIPPQNVFFDILEFEFRKIETIQAFAEYHRALGFFICLDDLCNGYSNIDKILYLTPDIIKININALRSMDQLSYSDHFVKLINTITEQLGILVVAKGIEDEKDVHFSFNCGAEFMQGFYISKPQDLTPKSLEEIVLNYRNLMDEHHIQDQTERELTRNLTSKAIRVAKGLKESIHFVNKKMVLMDPTFYFNNYPMIENIWVINNEGKQVGESIINRQYETKNATLFQVYNPGADFSSKDIYTQVCSTMLDVWVTQPFKSVLTNNICVTCSQKIDCESEEAILCMNINFDALSRNV